MPKPLFQPLKLASGGELPNRIVKASMEESLATEDQLPSDALIELYRQWGQGGCGLLLTGNVMVDHMAMTGPGGVALEANTPLGRFQDWANAAKAGGSKVWMQINHPGRQVFAGMKGKALSASDIPLDLGKNSKLFAQPKAMSEEEIQDVIQRFAATAKNAVAAGFDGVQIHAAHGYLITQFLSPLSNKRTDKWGGSLENRARLLLEVVKAVRANLPSDAAVGIKLNSADFQRGGFQPEDAKQVVAMLDNMGVDLIELSGGSYETPAMQGRTSDERTLAREAYFLEFAEEIAQSTDIAIMTTGGVRRLEIAEKVVSSGVAAVGIATALAYHPSLPNHWQNNSMLDAIVPPIEMKNKDLAAFATMAVVKRQMRRMGNGKKPLAKPSPLFSLIKEQFRSSKLQKRYRERFAS
ncbi:NADH:flavin oxidoreductase/NADH oxidase family protein [Candidatus Albibeggiatoa sp. nov. NOAA]|uniref:NADH:flavin oxidoreductase/NADH oxidase family protein n=1 Tax=Candidatus Albibeggiatoa sp. nov. NOAA TaxID=3162724 RepID=UPI0032F3412D|nr:NADH:flavin oxidoreductase/NADH oxidase family protein [Thiotrichaceae bacterium]